MRGRRVFDDGVSQTLVKASGGRRVGAQAKPGVAGRASAILETRDEQSPDPFAAPGLVNIDASKAGSFWIGEIGIGRDASDGDQLAVIRRAKEELRAIVQAPSCSVEL